MAEWIQFALAVLACWYAAWWLGDLAGSALSRITLAILRRYRPDWVRRG